MLVAIERGYVQQQIQDSAYAYQRAIEKGEQIVVGVNKFQIEEEGKSRKILRVDPSVAEKQIARLKALKERRDNVKVGDALEEIRKAARDESQNLMPKILEAVKAYATLGEICNVLREEFGEYKESIIL